MKLFVLQLRKGRRGDNLAIDFGIEDEARLEEIQTQRKPAIRCRQNTQRDPDHAHRAAARLTMPAQPWFAQPEMALARIAIACETLAVC
jgi:hypothetical protein